MTENVNVDWGELWLNLDSLEDIATELRNQCEDYTYGDVQKEYDEVLALKAKGEKVYPEEIISPLNHMEAMLDNLKWIERYVKSSKRIMKLAIAEQKKQPDKQIDEFRRKGLFNHFLFG